MSIEKILTNIISNKHAPFEPTLEPDKKYGFGKFLKPNDSDVIGGMFLLGQITIPAIAIAYLEHDIGKISGETGIIIDAVSPLPVLVPYIYHRLKEKFSKNTGYVNELRKKKLTFQ